MGAVRKAKQKAVPPALPRRAPVPTVVVSAGELLAWPLWQEKALAYLRGHARRHPTSWLLLPAMLFVPGLVARWIAKTSTPPIDVNGVPLRRTAVRVLVEQYRQGSGTVAIAASEDGFAEALAHRLGFRTFVAARTDRFAVLPRDRFSWASVAEALRPHQWAKNLLLFVPLFLAHRYDNWMTWESTLWAFVAFCFTASAVYLMNDVIDLHRDRRHPSKRHRPIASGAIPFRAVLAAVPLLLAGAYVVGDLYVGQPFLYALGAYLAGSTIYNVFLSRVPLADIVCLTGLYVVRFVAGGEASRTPVSFWLLGFATFFFLSLAILKRYVEVVTLHATSPEHASEGRAGYRFQDAPLLMASGLASAFVATFVLALYVNTYDVTRLYYYPKLLWAVGPLVLYWQMRTWFLAQRGMMNFDPVLFALRDRVSLAVAAACGTIVLFAGGHFGAWF
jgi:4-hydroxybenzoate polyprenyltransferase